MAGILSYARQWGFDGQADTMDDLMFLLWVERMEESLDAAADAVSEVA